MFKKNQIVVRTGGSTNPKGTIYKVEEDSTQGYNGETAVKDIDDGARITPYNHNLRLATQSEIAWFNKGITNINDIPKDEIINDYLKF